MKECLQTANVAKQKILFRFAIITMLCNSQELGLLDVYVTLICTNIDKSKDSCSKYNESSHDCITVILVYLSQNSLMAYFGNSRVKKKKVCIRA